MTSKLANQVYDVLRDIFPQARIFTEHYVNCEGNRLFFDYYLPQYNILVEVQGEQHYKYTPFFHGAPSDYRQAVKRDKLKQNYALANNFTLVIVDYNEDVSREMLLTKISEAQNGLDN